MAENLKAKDSLVCFSCFSIQADVLATIASNHVNQNVDVKLPFGVRQTKVPADGSKRKRTPHENQKFPLQGKKTKTFMEGIGEPGSTGGFSNLEFMIISSTVHC